MREENDTMLESNATVWEGGGATLPDDGTVFASAGGDTPIRRGDALLDTYRVESDAIQGGMGSVWRVHHAGWNVDLAMKRPQARFFAAEKTKADFIRECDAWINLGLHPNIVSCYYVRRIGGIPTIFSEWMDGGSLADAIEKGGLYEGSGAEQRERILDIAIQFARGLHYAHECRDENGGPGGLVHQDVKPGNLLLTKEGEAKVADFGLAKARAVLTVFEGGALEPAAHADSGGTMFSPAGGYTPAYCSMEQMDGQKLTRRTDIYSWAVSVMEMYAGARPWANGVVAGLNCREYFAQARVPVPQGMKELLKWCLETRESARPRDFSAVEEKLLELYKKEMDCGYPRPVSKAAANTVDSLNNRALSLLDLGKTEHAERCWERALGINPAHRQAVYNHSLHLWRGAKIDDAEALERVKKAEGGQGELTAQILTERGQARYIQSFAGHTDWVNSVSVSADGGKLLSGSYGDIRLWDVSSGACILTINGHDQSVHSVCLSRDGTKALSGAADHAVKLWDLSNGACLHTCLGHAGPVAAVDFAPDGKMAVSGSHDGTLKLWDVKTGALLRTFAGHQDRVAAACFLPCGTKVLSGSWDRTLKLWDVSSGACVRAFTGHDKQVAAVCLTKDGNRAASGGMDNTIRLWDIPAGACVGMIPKCITAGDKIPVESVSFSPDGKRVAMGSGDGTVKLWDLQTKRCVYTYMGYGAPVKSVAFMPDGGRIAAGSIDKMIRLWGLPAAGHAAMALNRIQTTAAVSFFRSAFDGIRRDIEAAVQSGDIQTALTRLEALRHTPMFGESNEYFEQKRKVGRFCRMGKILSHRVIAVRKKEKEAGGGMSRCSCASQDGSKELYTRRWDENDFYLRDLRDSSVSVTFTGHTFYVRSLCFSADAGKALSASWDHTIKLWDARTGQCLRTFAGHSQGVNWACFSPDETKLLSGGMDKEAKLWDVASGNCIDTMDEHTEYVRHVSFGSDGAEIIASSDTQSIVYLIDCALSFPGWADWDEGARPHLANFLSLHPNWTDTDFHNLLIAELQNRGYGWLRPGGVRAKLEEMGGTPTRRF